MIGELAVLLAIVLAAGGIGLWLGIVVLAPRLQRRIDRSTGEEPEPAKESDGRAD